MAEEEVGFDDSKIESHYFGPALEDDASDAESLPADPAPPDGPGAMRLRPGRPTSLLDTECSEDISLCSDLDISELDSEKRSPGVTQNLLPKTRILSQIREGKERSPPDGAESDECELPPLKTMAEPGVGLYKFHQPGHRDESFDSTCSEMSLDVPLRDELGSSTAAYFSTLETELHNVKQSCFTMDANLVTLQHLRRAKPSGIAASDSFPNFYGLTCSSPIEVKVAGNAVQSPVSSQQGSCLSLEWDNTGVEPQAEDAETAYRRAPFLVGEDALLRFESFSPLRTPEFLDEDLWSDDSVVLSPVRSRSCSTGSLPSRDSGEERELSPDAKEGQGLPVSQLGDDRRKRKRRRDHTLTEQPSSSR